MCLDPITHSVAVVKATHSLPKVDVSADPCLFECHIIGVEFSTEGGFNPGRTQKLFTGADAGMGSDNTMTSYNPEYDVTPDGTHFVIVRRLER